MSSVHLVSFATEKFEQVREELISSAKSFNVNSHFQFDREDVLASEFYKRNQQIFSHDRGFGFWIWKPFVILEALKQIQENDILIYADAGSLFLEDPKPLADLAENSQSGIIPFDAWPLTNSQFVKRDTFLNLDCDTPIYWDATHVIATIIVIRKTSFAVNFIEEWLKACENFSSISDQPNIHGKENLPGFISHREDQAIFSLLVKMKNLETYRNPSKWGNFLKLPAFRTDNELVCYPYMLKNDLKNYSDQPYTNSPYGTLFEFNRFQQQSPSEPAKIERRTSNKLFQFLKNFKSTT